jgi:TetR/AcrR family transcriptional regulator
MATTQTVRRKPRAGSRHQPEQTRQAILDAAADEFAAEGIAGARTEAIARAAGVNKALLYYYFNDKEALYGAVLDRVFAGLHHVVQEQLDRDLPPREKILAYAGAHFDYIASSPMYPRLVMREMMHMGRNYPPHIPAIVRRYFKPMAKQLSEVIRRGIAAGEFRPVDPLQFIPSMVALNVFYFSSAPVMRLLTGKDPLTRARVRARRAAVLDFISAALFRPQEPKGGRP